MDPLILNRHWSQEVDRRAVLEYGLTGLVLMENAGRGVVDRLAPRLAGLAGPVAICCGRGNNGGDGFVIARHLDLRGHAVEIMLCADPETLIGDAATNYEIVRRAGLPMRILGRDLTLAALAERLTSTAWIVDALLGTGARGRPRAPLSDVIDVMNATGRSVVAVDLPSGLDCDAGVVSPQTVRATLTCTFVALKPGLVAAGAADYAGEVAVLDIGAPRKLIAEITAAAHSV